MSDPPQRRPPGPADRPGRRPFVLLALDTATAETTVALLGQEQVLAEAGQPARNHSLTLLPAVERILGQSNLQREDLGAVAVGVGPGSFTGVRVGLTLAKALAYALEIDLVGVSTLRALAENGREQEEQWICPVLDALKQEVYAARYRREGGALVEVQVEAARDPRGWALELRDAGGSFLLLGTGAQRYREVFCEVLGERAVVPQEPQLHRVRARAVGLLGLWRLRRGERDDPRALEPCYCRLSEAELNRMSRGGL